ncbi:hypothetical protein FOA52_016142 [Chlamydomonas sp. UWO 241]|nr:hypothetical protein FOA52_016142 [Chlamydomonas sp. UWO 241]
MADCDLTRDDGVGPSSVAGARGAAGTSGGRRERNRGQAGASSTAQHVDLTTLVDSPPRASDDDVVFVMSKPGPVRSPGALKRSRQLAAAAAAALAGSSKGAAALANPLAHLPGAYRRPPSPDRGKAKCAICLDGMEQPASTPCGHVFCHSCLVDCIKAQRKCPKCRKSCALKQIHRIYLDT